MSSDRPSTTRLRLSEPRSRRIVALTLTAGFAFVLRVAVVAMLAGPVGEERLTYEHGEIAENLLAGRGFTVRYLGAEGPTSQQAPLYPVMLAGCYALFGVESPSAILAMQLLQCVAGVGIVLASFWLARNLVPAQRSVAWTTALLAAAYPPHVYMVTHIQVVVWAALLLVVLLAVVTTPRLAGTPRGAVLGGTLSGLILLTDPILAVALPIAALAFWRFSPRRFEGNLGRSRWNSPFACAAGMALIALLVISPWLVRNRQVHGEWVFIKSSFGYAFWQGNNPQSWGTDKIPKPEAQQILEEHDGTAAGWHQAMWKARHETLYIDDVLLTPDDYRVMGGMSEPERSRYLGRRAYAFIREQPQEYARLCAQRLAFFLGIDPTNPKTAHPVYRGSVAVWMVLATLGLLVSGPSWRTLWPSLATFAALTLFHALTIVSVRFRMPIEPLSFVWAGLAVGPLAARLIAAWRDAAREELEAVPGDERADSEASSTEMVVLPRLARRDKTARKKSAA